MHLRLIRLFLKLCVLEKCCVNDPMRTNLNKDWRNWNKIDFPRNFVRTFSNVIFFFSWESFYDTWKCFNEFYGSEQPQVEKQEDSHAEEERMDDSTRAQQSHAGSAVSSTYISFVQYSLPTKAATLSLCWAWKPVPHSVSPDAGDWSVAFSNTIHFQDIFSFVWFLFLVPQLKNASKHPGKFWVIALILGRTHVRLLRYLVLWPVHRAGSSGSVQGTCRQILCSHARNVALGKM